MDPPSRRPLIGVVGPCGSGKSTLIRGLEKQGFICRHIAQEHSYVQAMWQIIAHPDILIYLNSSFAASTSRRNLNWDLKDYKEQLRRLAHARAHAGIIIDTDYLTIEQVLKMAIDYLNNIEGGMDISPQP